MNLNQTGVPLYAGGSRNHKMAIAVGSSVGTVSLIFIAVGLFLWWRQRHNQNTFFDVKGLILLSLLLAQNNLIKFFFFIKKVLLFNRWESS
jgi:hypothetical protein